MYQTLFCPCVSGNIGESPTGQTSLTDDVASPRHVSPMQQCWSKGADLFCILASPEGSQRQKQSRETSTLTQTHQTTQVYTVGWSEIKLLLKKSPGRL